MWRYSKLARSLAAIYSTRRQHRTTLSIAIDAPVEDEDEDAQSSSAWCSPWLEQRFPGIDRRILSKLDNDHDGDIPDDVVDMLDMASSAINVACSL
jgi:hypothetical protein